MEEKNEKLENQETEEYSKETAKMPKGFFGGLLKGNLRFILVFVLIVVLIAFVYYKVMLNY